MSTFDNALWEEIREAEIASAFQPCSAQQYAGLCSRYARLGLHEEAVRLSKRLIRLKVDLKALLPFVLDALSQQRSLKELASAVVLAKAQNATTPSLRRALAKALHFMGQIRPAAEEWEAVVANGFMSERDWFTLARFMIEHNDIEGLGTRVEEALPSVSDGPALLAARLCTLCYHIGHDVKLARARLTEIPPTAFADVDLAVALAVLAFRMADYDYAEAAASHALEGKPSGHAVVSILESIRAFGGKSANLESIHVDLSAAEALPTVCGSVKSDEYAWGVLCRSDSGSVEATHQPFQCPEDRVLELAEIPNLLASFSCLPVAADTEATTVEQFPDPLEVLPYVDYEVPHLMLQRLPDGEPPRMHVFIGASGDREWCWKQVRPIYDGQEDPKCLPSRGSQLWKAAACELLSRTTEEE